MDLLDLHVLVHHGVGFLVQCADLLIVAFGAVESLRVARLFGVDCRQVVVGVNPLAYLLAGGVPVGYPEVKAVLREDDLAQVFVDRLQVEVALVVPPGIIGQIFKSRPVHMAEL